MLDNYNSNLKQQALIDLPWGLVVELSYILRFG